MAKVLENECVSCDLPCMGSACPNRNVPYYYCDDCDDCYEPSELYMHDGKMFCKDCLTKMFKTVEQEGI